MALPSISKVCNCTEILISVCIYTYTPLWPVRFLYEADVVLVLEEGRVTQCGHPRKVLPLVEEQLQQSTSRDNEGAESGGGAMGGATNKGDVKLQVRKLSEYT